jgi:hypothetical protein
MADTRLAFMLRVDAMMRWREMVGVRFLLNSVQVVDSQENRQEPWVMRARRHRWRGQRVAVVRRFPFGALARAWIAGFLALCGSICIDISQESRPRW